MIIEDVLRAYNDTQSIRQTAKETGCSWQRVVKILSSNGVVINQMHRIILMLYEEGKSPEEIAKQIGYNEKVVKAYLPRKRPYYGVNPSDNAKAIKRCRKSKENEAKEQ